MRQAAAPLSAVQPRASSAVSYALLGGALLVCMLLGALLGLSAYPLVLGMLGLIVGCAILASPRLAVWVTLVGALCFAGLVELYLPGLQQVRWLFSLLSIALVLVAAVRYLTEAHAHPRSDPGVVRITVLALCFVASVLAASIASGTPVMAMVVGLKNYFQMWGVLAALALFRYEPAQVTRFVRLLAMLSLVQLPFVLHQFFALVPQRNTQAAAEHFVVAVDIVAGTFGGSMAGGGRSSDLAILASIAIIYFFARWKYGQASLVRTLLLSAIAFSPMMFNEAKLALVLVPLGLLILFPGAILRRPFAMMLGAGLLIGVLVAIVAIYSMLPGADGQRSRSVDDFVQESLAYNIGKKGYGSAVLNRTTVYPFWWQEHAHRDDWRGAIFGHGPGATNQVSTTVTETLATKRYLGYAIGLTGLSTLLWETGIVGTGIFVALIAYATLHARRLRRREASQPWQAELQAAQIGLVLLGVSLLHSNYVAFDLGYQGMFVLLLGYLLAMSARGKA